MSTAQEIRRPGPRPVGEGTWFAGRAGLVMPAIVAVFYPNLMVEIVGAAIMTLALVGNWLASRREAVTA